MIQDQPTLTLGASDPFLMPPRTPHNAVVGPETGRMLSTYIVEVGQPLATLVDGPPVAAATLDTDMTRDVAGSPAQCGSRRERRCGPGRPSSQAVIATDSAESWPPVGQQRGTATATNGRMVVESLSEAGRAYAGLTERHHDQPGEP